MFIKHLLCALVWISQGEAHFLGCRRVEGEAAAKSRGVGGGRAVGDKAGGRWCLVRGLCDRSLDFLPLTPRQAQLPQNAGGTRREEAGRARGGDGHEKPRGRRQRPCLLGATRDTSDPEPGGLRPWSLLVSTT